MPSLEGSYPAPTYHSVEWSGFGTIPKYRLRCGACDKVVLSQERALRAAENMRRTKGLNWDAYLGPCGHWHLTSHRKRRDR